MLIYTSSYNRYEQIRQKKSPWRKETSPGTFLHSISFFYIENPIYMNKSFFGISDMNCLRSFSKNAMESLLKP